jgi:hypothetical protein
MAKSLFAGSDADRRNWPMSSGDMPKKARRVRFDVAVSADTLEAIDNYRFATRAPNRVEAVRRLLRAGLSAEPPDSVSIPQDR